MWLGMASFEMALVVYVLCILAAIWCVVHGRILRVSQGHPDLPFTTTPIVARLGPMRC